MPAETIYALSSGPGRAAVAVVRVSGPNSASALKALLQRDSLPIPRRATFAGLWGADRLLDQALVLWLPGPSTATGEDIVELHLHGGPAVLRSVLGALGGLPGLRLAEPGEFTRRAFLNGKMDLTQAEGIADLIDAETEMQANQALGQIEGRLRDLYESWRARIVKGLAYVEAVLDFPDEDVPDSAAAYVAPDLKSVMDEICAHLEDGHRGEIVREGLSVTLLGPPNAGKSSLLNALARRDIAIVSDIAGTTRDVLEARLNIAGYAINIADTAGLRETVESIESEGIRRALLRAASAQVRLLLIDEESLDEFQGLVGHLKENDLVIWSKADRRWLPPQVPIEALSVSSLTGEGLDDLARWLGQAAAARTGSRNDALLTRARHREALLEAKRALGDGLAVLEVGLDLAAEDFRVAAHSIGRITGRVDVEDVLDVVFRDFCIGK